ncbi:MAG: ABC transporter substrate-binding protein [Rhodobacteraceae bacterium]|nr:ABC transporter substrate-binding protein [Paracoccaceae bacterium]
MVRRFLFIGLLLLTARAFAAPLQIVVQALPETYGDPFSYSALPTGLINHALFEKLLRIEGGGKVEPELATDWTQEGPTTWVFHLRPNVEFSNGVPFNADAVITAVDYLLGDPAPHDRLSGRLIREKVANVSARDELTVVFETRVIDPILPVHVASLPIPEPNQWKKGVEYFAAAPIGTGPYQLKAWETKSVELVPNERARRKGHVPAIVIRAVQDQTARGMALLSGSADIALDVSGETFDGAAADGSRLVPRTSTMVQFFQFVAVGDGPLKDVRVRRALNYAVNKEQLIGVFLHNATKPATQFTHEDAVGYNTSLASYPYDPDRARVLLEDAGWAQGLKVPTVFVSGSGSDVAIYQRVAADLAAMGVDMELRSITYAAFMERLFSGDWGSRAFVTGIQGYDPLGAFTTRSCDWTNPHYCDRDLMPLLNEARQSRTRPELISRIEALMAYEHDNPPGILLWRRLSFDQVSARVQNYVADRDYFRFDLLEVKE